MSNRSYYTHFVTIMSDYVTIMSIMSITHSGQLCLIISLPGNEPLLQLCQYYHVKYVLWPLGPIIAIIVIMSQLCQLCLLKTIISMICVDNYYVNYFVLYLLCQL